MRDADEVTPEVREVRDPREVQIVDQGGLLDVVHNMVRRKDDVILFPAERDPFEEFLVARERVLLDAYVVALPGHIILEVRLERARPVVVPLCDLEDVRCRAAQHSFRHLGVIDDTGSDLPRRRRLGRSVDDPETGERPESEHAGDHPCAGHDFQKAATRERRRFDRVLVGGSGSLLRLQSPPVPATRHPENANRLLGLGPGAPAGSADQGAPRDGPQTA